MGYKKVCFNCKKAFSVYKNNQKDINLTCPNCGGITYIFNHKFRPPAQSNNKGWKIVEFLKDNGFVYQHVYKKADDDNVIEVKYPKNMEEAKSFVKLYKSQAYSNID